MACDDDVPSPNGLRLDYDNDTGSYRTFYDRFAGAKPSTTVLLAIDEIVDGALSPDQPMNDVVDPDALDRIFDSLSEDSPRPEGQVTFEFCGHRVRVHANGEIIISPSRD